MIGMSDLVINISWEYFFGILGTLIALAYYANGRFTRLETNFQWLADALRDLTIKAENISAKLFDASSPVALTFLANAATSGALSRNFAVATSSERLHGTRLNSVLLARSTGRLSENVAW